MSLKRFLSNKDCLRPIGTDMETNPDHGKRGLLVLVGPGAFIRLKKNDKTAKYTTTNTD